VSIELQSTSAFIWAAYKRWEADVADDRENMVITSFLMENIRPFRFTAQAYSVFRERWPRVKCQWYVSKTSEFKTRNARFPGVIPWRQSLLCVPDRYDFAVDDEFVMDCESYTFPSLRVIFRFDWEAKAATLYHSRQKTFGDIKLDIE
jgi:hypothetical protein